MSKDMNITRIIAVDEEMWTPLQKDEKGNFLSLDEQRGIIQLDLTVPLELSDREPVEHLQVKAPNTRQIQAFQAGNDNEPPATAIKREIDFYGGCCVGIVPSDVENLHGRDWSRLSRLVTNFIS